MRPAMYAIIRKDLKGVTDNRQLFLPILLVPLILIVVLPTIFILSVRFIPEDAGDFNALLAMLPQTAMSGGIEQALIGLILNNILPVFFLIIPIMTASVMAASSFVGEKEKHTLETLLYCPLPLGRIFYAKILCVPSFLWGDAPCHGNGTVRAVRKPHNAFGKLADHAVPPLTGSLTDRHHTHRERLCQSPVYGGITAKGGLSYPSAVTAHRRTVRRDTAHKPVAAPDSGGGVCHCRLASDARLQAQVHI